MAAHKKQTELPGVEREAHPTIDPAAAAYTQRMYKRKDIQAEEKQAKQTLISEMEANGVSAYMFVDGEYDYEIVLEEKVEKVLKTKRTKRGAESDNDAGVIEFPKPKGDADGDGDGDELDWQGEGEEE